MYLKTGIILPLLALPMCEALAVNGRVDLPTQSTSTLSQDSSGRPIESIEFSFEDLSGSADRNNGNGSSTNYGPGSVIQPPIFHFSPSVIQTSDQYILRAPGMPTVIVPRVIKSRIIPLTYEEKRRAEEEDIRNIQARYQRLEAQDRNQIHRLTDPNSPPNVRAILEKRTHLELVEPLNAPDAQALFAEIHRQIPTSASGPNLDGIQKIETAIIDVGSLVRWLKEIQTPRDFKKDFALKLARASLQVSIESITESVRKFRTPAPLNEKLDLVTESNRQAILFLKVASSEEDSPSGHKEVFEAYSGLDWDTQQRLTPEQRSYALLLTTLDTGPWDNPELLKQAILRTLKISPKIAHKLRLSRANSYSPGAVRPFLDLEFYSNQIFRQVGSLSFERLSFIYLAKKARRLNRIDQDYNRFLQGTLLSNPETTEGLFVRDGISAVAQAEAALVDLSEDDPIKTEAQRHLDQLETILRLIDRLFIHGQDIAANSLIREVHPYLEALKGFTRGLVEGSLTVGAGLVAAAILPETVVMLGTTAGLGYLIAQGIHAISESPTGLSGVLQRISENFLAASLEQQGEWIGEGTAGILGLLYGAGLIERIRPVLREALDLWVRRAINPRLVYAGAESEGGITTAQGSSLEPLDPSVHFAAHGEFGQVRQASTLPIETAVEEIGISDPTICRITDILRRHGIEINFGENASRIDKVLMETFERRGDFTSSYRLSQDEAIEVGRRWVGEGYREIGRRPNSGVFESADGLRRYRIDNGSIQGRHNPNVPHVHLEEYAWPGAAEYTANNHIPFGD